MFENRSCSLFLLNENEQICIAPFAVHYKDASKLWLCVKLEDNLEKEKKQRADVEKNKRKLETDLKSTQETLEELERVKRELEETVRRWFTSLL